MALQVLGKLIDFITRKLFKLYKIILLSALLYPPIPCVAASDIILICDIQFIVTDTHRNNSSTLGQVKEQIVVYYNSKNQINRLDSSFANKKYFDDGTSKNILVEDATDIIAENYKESTLSKNKEITSFTKITINKYTGEYKFFESRTIWKNGNPTEEYYKMNADGNCVRGKSFL